MAAATIHDIESLEGRERGRAIAMHFSALSTTVRHVEQRVDTLEGRMILEFGKLGDKIERLQRHRSPLEGRSEDTEVTILKLLEHRDMAKDADFTRALRKGTWGVFWKIATISAVVLFGLFVAALWSQVHH